MHTRLHQHHISSHPALLTTISTYLASPYPMKRATTASQRTAQLSRHLHHTMASPTSEAAPWRAALLSHIDKLKSPTFNLSTLHPISSRSPSSSASKAIQFSPRARTVVFRGMWASLPVNPKNAAKLNPEGVYESDLLTITSDARMEKIPELFQSLGTENGESTQSGQGGPIEAVFWVEETSTQWRIRGHAVVVGPDIDDEVASPVREALTRHMRQISSPAGADGQANWSFARELTAHFGNLSPTMRGTFRNPPPGTPLRRENLSPGLGLGQKVEDLDDEIARKNFRVVVLVPEEVDRVDLTNPDEGKRWNYALKDGEKETRTWEATELWP